MSLQKNAVRFANFRPKLVFVDGISCTLEVIFELNFLCNIAIM